MIKDYITRGENESGSKHKVFRFKKPIYMPNGKIIGNDNKNLGPLGGEVFIDDINNPGPIGQAVLDAIAKEQAEAIQKSNSKKS